MIVLSPNNEQYKALNGYKNNGSTLIFVKDGLNNWVVGLQVLNDANFAPIHPQLNELEKIEYTPLEDELLD